jgi:hypothetical protein
MGTRSVEADQGITPTIAHTPTGIVHGIDPPNGGFEKMPVEPPVTARRPVDGPVGVSAGVGIAFPGVETALPGAV